MSDAVRKVVESLADRLAPTGAQIEAAFDAILRGDTDPVLISAFLVGLRIKGESVDDIEAGARVMRKHARSVTAPDDIVDTCGTGGLPWVSLNTSTASAFVVAGAGGRVAKHGNRSVPPKTGSADVLEALGVNLSPDDAQFQKCLMEARVGFLFAQAHHSAMRHVAPVRKTLGLRTIFNLLGPLSNPAGAKRQVLGVFDKAWVEPMAHVLHRLGSAHAWVVHGDDGLDEITVTAPTQVAEVKPSGVTCFTVSPEECGLAIHPIDALKGGSVQANAAAIKTLLSGEKSAFRDIVAMNAGAALLVSGKADTLSNGVRLALSAIDDGRARTALEKLVEYSNKEA